VPSSAPVATWNIDVPSPSQPVPPPLPNTVTYTPEQRTAPQSKACLFCGEQVLAVAKKCKHCGEILDTSLNSISVARPPPLVSAKSDAALASTSASDSPASPIYLLWIAGGLVGYLIMAGVFVIKFSKQEAPTKETPIRTATPAAIRNKPAKDLEWVNAALQISYLKNLQTIIDREDDAPTFEIQKSEFETTPIYEKRRREELADYHTKLNDIRQRILVLLEELQNHVYKITTESESQKDIKYDADKSTLIIPFSDGISASSSIARATRYRGPTTFMTGILENSTDIKLVNPDGRCDVIIDDSDSKHDNLSQLQESFARNLAKTNAEAMFSSVEGSLPVIRENAVLHGGVKYEQDSVGFNGVNIHYDGIPPELARAMKLGETTYTQTVRFQIKGVKSQKNGERSYKDKEVYADANHFEIVNEDHYFDLHAWICDINVVSAEMTVAGQIHVMAVNEPPPVTVKTSEVVSPKQPTASEKQPVHVSELPEERQYPDRSKIEASTLQNKIFTSKPPFRISISVTGQWEQFGDPDSSCLLRLQRPIESPRDKYDERIVVYGPFDVTKSIEQCFVDLTAQLQKGGFVLIKKEPFQNAQFGGIHSIWDCTDPEGRDLRVTRTLIRSGKHDLLVNCFALRTEFEKWGPAFKEALQTLTMPETQESN